MANRDSLAESSEDLLDTAIQVNITAEEMKEEVKDEMRYLFIKTESSEPFYTTGRNTPNSMRTSPWPAEDEMRPSCTSFGMNDMHDLVHYEIHGEQYVKVELTEKIGGNDVRAEAADETLQTEIEKKMARKAAKKANPEYLQNRKKKHLRRKEEKKKMKRAEREARVPISRSLQLPSSSATSSQCRKARHPHPMQATTRIVGSVGNTPQLTFFRRQCTTTEYRAEALVNQEAFSPVFPAAIPTDVVRHLTDPIRPPLSSRSTLLGAPPPASIPLMGQLPAPFHRSSTFPSPQAYSSPPANPYQLPAHVQSDRLYNHWDQGGYDKDRLGRDWNSLGNHVDRDGATSYRKGHAEGPSQWRGSDGAGRTHETEPSPAILDQRRLSATIDNGSANQSPRTPNSPPRIHQSPGKTKVQQEKADFILQVLRLREEVIAALAPEQQKTVRTLQEQFKELLK